MQLLINLVSKRPNGIIDSYSKKHDIYDYMKANKVTPTFNNVFYRRNGAAAKVNIACRLPTEN